jgi:hypothetical protein
VFSCVCHSVSVACEVLSITGIQLRLMMMLGALRGDSTSGVCGIGMMVIGVLRNGTGPRMDVSSGLHHSHATSRAAHVSFI